MTNTTKVWLAALLGLASFTVQAQDAQYSQFYASPLYWNPANAGTAFKQRAVLNWRNQYPALNSNFVTTSLSYDTYKPKWNAGLGVQLTNDRLANGLMQNNLIMLSYSLRTRVAENTFAHFGIGAGASIRSINFSRMTFGDSFTPGGTGQTAESAVSGGNVFNPELSLGVLIYQKNWFFGLAGHHLAFQSVNFAKGGINEVQAPRFNFNTGYKIYFDERHWASSKQASNITITPNLQYRIQGPFHQLDLGATFNYKFLLVGGYLRGIPLLSNTSAFTQDVFSTMVGVTYNDLQVGYSYDTNMNSLSQGLNASHEISLIYCWRLFVPRPKKEYAPLPCPKI